MGQIRIGQSRLREPPPLLTQVGGKPIRQLRIPKSIDDPPLSTDDDDDDEGEEAAPSHECVKDDTSSKGRKGPKPADSIKSSPSGISEDSDAGKPNRGDIQKTTFGPNTALARKFRQSGRSISIDKPKADVKTKQKRPGDCPNDGASNTSGGHLTDDYGIFKRKPATQTYSKKQSSSQEFGRSRTSRYSSAPRPSLRDVPALDSPKKKKLKLQQLPSSPASSPSKDHPTEVKKSTRRVIRKPQVKLLPSPSPPPPPPPARIIMPLDLPEISQETGGMSGTPGNAMLDVGFTSDEDAQTTDTVPMIEDVGDRESQGHMTVCPWCGDPVAKALLEEFSKGKRLNVRMQSRFCQKHKKQTAVETWTTKQYPTVRWDDLEGRFRMHHDHLLGIVNGEASHFRTILAEKIQTGQARSLKKEDNMNPGYYGPRGFNIMCDYLVDQFSDLLKEKAVSDRVIAGRGSAAFIQSVLVAELAVRLIKEDMDVSTEEALEIMEESKSLGEMIHEDA